VSRVIQSWPAAFILALISALKADAASPGCGMVDWHQDTNGLKALTTTVVAQQ
jgi:hypothetical protein